MLVLSRNVGEEVVITCGTVEIVVTVSQILRGRGQGKVRLGFEAPLTVTINRREVHDGIHGAKQEEGQ